MTIHLLGILILAGLIFLFISLIKFRKLIKFVINIISTEDISIDYLFKINFYLILIFLIGYIIIFVLNIFGYKFISEILIGIIFLLVAIFVFSGIILQSDLVKSLNTSNMQTIKILVSAVEARDPYTMGHSEHVANLLILLYQYLPGFTKKSLNPNILKYTGLLHDIGKIGIPENILNSPTQLNFMEMEIMKQHTMIGESIIKNVDWLRPICKWVLYHHERLDGKGYFQLKGDDIPYVSKMIAVVDTYSSLVTERKYRPARSNEEAIEILKDTSITQFDKELVDIFSNIDVNLVVGCLPGKKSIINKINDESFIKEDIKGMLNLLNRHVLNKETGISCIKKYFELVNRIDLNLTIAVIYIKGISENSGIDYHDIDRFNSLLESILNKRVRKSDIICRLNSFKYILLVQNCSVAKLKSILEKLITDINKNLGNSEIKKRMEIELNYFEYNSKNKKSLDQINLLLNEK